MSNPAKNPRSTDEGYVSLTFVLEELGEIDQLSSLPFKVNLSNLNDGSGLFETMKRNNAKYKSCKKECSNSRRARAQKRVHVAISQNACVYKCSPVKTRRQSETFQKKVCCATAILSFAYFSVPLFEGPSNFWIKVILPEKLYKLKFAKQMFLFYFIF